MLKCLYRNIKMTALEKLYKDVYLMTDAEYFLTDGFELREKSHFLL